jgi:hypothetical protein
MLESNYGANGQNQNRGNPYSQQLDEMGNKITSEPITPPIAGQHQYNPNQNYPQQNNAGGYPNGKIFVVIPFKSYFL